jgi:spore coat polysaccharide biosynthesis protein SpsF
VDTREDLEVIRRLVEEYGADKMACKQIIDLLDAHPEIVALNSHVDQKKPGQ